MKKLFLSAAIFSAAAVPTTALAQDSSVTVYSDVVSEYVFRGVSLGETSIQPGVDVSYGNFTVGAWFSTQVGDTSQFSSDEVDLYASYNFSPYENVSADVGVTYFHYPQGGSLFGTDGGAAGTYEGFVSVGLDQKLSPSATVYYDFTLKNLTGEIGIGHSVPLDDRWSFDMGLTGGYVAVNDAKDYQWGTASAALAYGISDDASAYLGGNYVINSQDNTLKLEEVLLNDVPVGLAATKDNMIWFGAGISSSF